MPELPEVETVRRHIAPHLLKERLLDFVSFWPRQVLPSARALRRAARGRSIAAIERHGKRLLLLLESGSVLGVQLGMSGSLLWKREFPADRRHLRAYFRLPGGWLLFYDARKFGRIMYFENQAAAHERLGPDALRAARLAGELASRAAGIRRAIKTLLLDQSFLAGVGNIYADEALFRARIHPATPARRIRRAKLERLFVEVSRVLSQAIRCGGTSFDWVWRGGRMQSRLRVYGRAGESCPRCGAAVRRIVLGGRSAHFCPGCQGSAGGGRQGRRGRHGRVDGVDKKSPQGGKR